MATLIHSGTVIDGTGAAPRDADVLIGDDGRVERIGVGLDAPADAERIDATGCWVTPGFIDIHTHYDAELEVHPELTESLRHGVTTTLVGSCGLSLVVGDPEDLADTFCRVEGIPRSMVLPLLRRVVDWRSPTEYVEHLRSLPLGPNVVGMVGHSTIRAHVMGLGRSLRRDVRPDADEQAGMERLVEQSVDAGLLGVSVNLLPWDKMGGDRYRSRPTPSVFARFAEYRALAEVARRRDAVFQAIPNLQTRWTIGPLMDLSRPRRGRALRTSLLTLMDAPPAMGAFRVIGTAADALNRRAGAHVRFQALPTPFDLYTDGIENPVFEELGAGTEALHLEDADARRSLMGAPPYRERFARQWRSKLAARAYHRDLAEARIVDAPDASLAGRTFAEVAAERGVDPVDCFLDLQAAHGNDLRWYSVVANGDESNLRWITAHPAAMIGFSDAGAHLRNMAFYNFGLRMLRRVRDAQAAGEPFMTVERAVARLTSEIADFHRLDAGRLRPGSRGDAVVIDPAHLDDTLEEVHEAPMQGVADLPDGEDFRRLVRRNDDTVRAVVVGGRVAWRDGSPSPDLGRGSGHGAVLGLTG